MRKVVTFLSVLALSSSAVAAKSDDVLQNIPSNPNIPIVAETSNDNANKLETKPQEIAPIKTQASTQHVKSSIRKAQ